MNDLHFEILDKKRTTLLPLLEKFKGRFYLAGGTALALQLGHRDSVDFDFFTNREFNVEELLLEIKRVFQGSTIEIAQAGNMTLNALIDNVSFSFFCIKAKILKPFLNTEYLNLASIDDIACMKIVALLRSNLKDYVDLYFIFKQKTLRSIFNDCKEKYDGFDELVYLKALGSFDDIEDSKILFQKGQKITKDQIRKDFERRVKEYLGAKI